MDTPRKVPDLDQLAHNDPSRAHIPPEIRAANRRRAVEFAERNAHIPKTPEFHAWMRDVFLPRYRELLAEREAQRDAEQNSDD